TAALPQEDVLGGLLADRAAAADSAALLVAPDRLLDRFTVEAVMAAEFAVFTGNHRRDHVAVDAAERRPGLRHAVLVHQHGGGDRHRHKPVNDHQRQADADEPDHRKNEETK